MLTVYIVERCERPMTSSAFSASSAVSAMCPKRTESETNRTFAIAGGEGASSTGSGFALPLSHLCAQIEGGKAAAQATTSSPRE